MIHYVFVLLVLFVLLTQCDDRPQLWLDACEQPLYWRPYTVAALEIRERKLNRILH